MKYYFKKNILAIVISIILMIASTVFACVYNSIGISDSDLEINKYQINLKINEDGSGYFNNFITYDFSYTDHTYTVIYEDIGYKKESVFAYGDEYNNKRIYKETSTSDASEFDYDSFVTKAYQDGKEITLTQVGYSFNNDIEMDTGDYVEAPYCNQERIFSYYRLGFTEDTTFNYQYKIKGMTSKFDDIGIVSWVLSPQTEIFIRNLSVNISFEKSLSNEDVEHLRNNFFVHGNISYDDFNVDKNGVSFNVKKQKSNQLVEVRMGFNNKLVPNVNENNTYDYDAQEYLTGVENKIKEIFEAYNKVYFGNQTALFIASGVFIVLLVLIWRSAYIKFDKERVSEFDSEYYRELPDTYPPAELGYLYNFKETTKDDLSATIMDLIRRGYIILDMNGETTQEEKPNYRYILNTNQDTSLLKTYERFVLEWYFSHIGNGSSVSLNEIDAYLKKEDQAQRYLNDNKKFIDLVRADARNNKFFDDIRNVSGRYWWYFALLVAAMIYAFMMQVSNYYTFGIVFSTFFLSLIILLACYFKTIKRRSEKGNEDYVRWKAFRNFLLEFGKFEDYTMPLISIWEHYMVYAVSFGIADEVEKQMRLHFKSKGEDNYYDTYSSSSPIFYSRSYIYVSRSTSNATVVARATIAQAQAARASKGGGGSFGGGRSFGGGGGGHGGR